MIAPSKYSLATLERNGVSAVVIDVANRMTECLRLAGDHVAESTGDDLFDDDNSRGFLLYRRTRNRIIEEFASDENVEVNTDDNALHVIVDSCALSFYSTRSGLEHPALATTSNTKRNVVDEMQLQLACSDMPRHRRLVLFHEADEDGVVGVALGVLRSRREWSWRVTMYDRMSRGEASSNGAGKPSYEEQPEAELPPIERRPESTPGHGTVDQQLGS